MKTKTNLISSFLVSAFLTLLYSCGGEATNEKEHDHQDGTHSHADNSHEHVFACPMHPEVTGKEGEKCPKCGMKFEHNDNVGNQNEYFMQFKMTPAEIEAGQQAVLAFTPKIKESENENEPVPLDVVHEKKLHLIIASNDLSYFEHIHPEYQSDGSYQIKVLAKGKDYTNGAGHNETKFENGGDYTLFADYVPTGATHKMDKIAINVKGNPYKPVSYTKQVLTKSVDGFTVSLETEGKWETGKQMHIKAVIKKGNIVLDANSFENYLGAKSHMVVLKTETFDYLHVHPEVENGCLDLHTTFESEGIYRGWLQFQTDGKVHVADFVIKVEAGNIKLNPEESHSAEHNH